MIKTFLDYEQHNRGLQPSTLQEYEKDLQEFMKYAQLATPRELLFNTDKRIINKWVADMSACGLKAATIKRRVSTLRSFFRFWVIDGMISKNPAQYIQTPILREQVTTCADFEAVKAYLSSTPKNQKETRMQAIVALIITTGVRISEALALDTHDIDKAHKAIRVNGKGGKQRVVYYTSETATYLNRYAKGMSGQIFSDWSARDVRDEMAKAIRSNGRGVHPHQLRHTFATLLIEKGASLQEVAQLLGHESTATTERYIHTANERTAVAYRSKAPSITE